MESEGGNGRKLQYHTQTIGHTGHLISAKIPGDNILLCPLTTWRRLYLKRPLCPQSRPVHFGNHPMAPPGRIPKADSVHRRRRARELTGGSLAPGGAELAVIGVLPRRPRESLILLARLTPRLMRGTIPKRPTII
jgi:hypothetical protein